MAQRSTLHDREIAFIQAQRVARLATSDEDGHPHVVPVCFAFDGSCFYTPLDEKPKRVEVRQLRRVRNIEARHEAMLLIDRYDDDWSRLGYVQIYGHAGLLMPGEPGHANALLLLRGRYVQYRTMALEMYPLIVIKPQRVVAWGSALRQT
ncbi:MAG TPA: TIGR03668 family PPOX class F420-dependent oxidoreductase [Ktedonobacteraceae bacterium]|nr:TIGR03668 family PPOX class F420-dependent oxidoreductase [Ktedonobacteraceae bacterium]